ncbi:putative ATP-dependent DNA helicase Lhr [Candidatus Nitrospira nitrificans]|uniref:Putative ATP-dependent DNA helicase Lhr n=1 Tax=Candidatus Nitrospira nitrificans TaxID=1742973 RepID=A0A0S4LQ58_9BACT|nr:DEAD/DEAH box helicase [Candidatus Nitrospira nitrificans]CUS39097.1 putative ATP-dependent DNA helicase Lhr [Candidatus Nitrospira nitrificans]
MHDKMPSMPLTRFHPIIADWFASQVGRPTDVQLRAWPAIQSGTDALIAAPTGSGKTLAAFLSCIDSLFKQALNRELDDHTSVLYVSPLKALSNDIQKNLQKPLAEIGQLALQAGLLMPELRALVRTGDTPMADRQQMLKRPPHILVTTPESLFILLTAEKSRRLLQTVRTVIVDEIHALAPNKRGAHLALSLERLEALTHVKPQRIGLSATQRPIELVARFLVGSSRASRADGQLLIVPDSPADGCQLSAAGSSPCTIIDVGHRRELDLAVEVPKDELSAVATNAIWSDVYDRVAELVRHHRSTLVFVNTRRLAERVSHYLEERLKDLGPDVVAAHHGSLSRQIRLSAEERLKTGKTRVVIATASLELGIDVGTVDLVCQIGSTRAIATALQRIGRAGHWIHAIPKGRLFAMTRDELLECAALVRAILQGTLDRITVPPAPLDILAQQLVAASAGQTWVEEDLFSLCRRAFPYRALSRDDFDAVVRMLADGIATRRGRGLAYLYHDRINHRIKGRRGARLAAITSGGAIPDTANYAVVAEPDGTVVGSVDEDFAVESLAGDIMLLGNTSWRIKRVEAGKVRVEDARGAPPSIPFWRGEAPSRTAELSAEVASLRHEIAARASSPADSEYSVLSWLRHECALDPRGAQQAIEYVLMGKAVLGVVPTQETVVAERFFDESGGMQLVIHAPFGGRINKAWGLALRKRFCVTFDFELQAAATDNGLVISLGEKHSFPLESVFGYLHSNSVRDVLIQAVLLAPMFATRWRWNVSRSLALLRFANGKKVPPQIQRMRAEDLLAAVFPDAIACQENLTGERSARRMPDHPLVQETIRDCLTEAMDLDGLIEVLRKIESGAIACIAVDTPAPSVLSHEILNANPYAFLDDAPLEERRARAVDMRRTLPPDLLEQVGALDPAAIEEVRRESRPVVRDPDELHDALLTLVWVPEATFPQWQPYLPPLVESGRAVPLALHARLAESKQASHSPRIVGEAGFTPYEVRGWVATENRERVEQLFAAGDDSTLDAMMLGWMESIGPTTISELATRLHLSIEHVEHAMLRLEASGQVLRGRFTLHASRATNDEIEWCHRRLLTRIHRLTIGILRKDVEPVTASEFMRFVMQWQHVTPGSRQHGEAGLLQVIGQVAGFEAAASAWEPQLLRLRMAKYEPELLDRLCLSGAVGWGRLSPHPNLSQAGAMDRRRIVPTSLAPISLFPREDREWLMKVFHGEATPTLADRHAQLSVVAQDLCHVLQQQGASFFADLARVSHHLPAEVENGLWELVAAGLVTADGFDNLRALINPHRRRAEGRERTRRPRHAGGRWSLLRQEGRSSVTGQWSSAPDQVISLLRQLSEASHRPSAICSVEPVARQLLRRYGVVFRDLLARESLVQSWRDLLVQYRRMEMAGEVRGGRFVTGFTGEQFALPEAVEGLRALRKSGNLSAGIEVKISACDPLNLAGIVLPGPRIPAVPTNFLILKDGVVARTVIGRQGETAPFAQERIDARAVQQRS